MSGTKEKILHQSSELKEEVIRLRRHFHKFPELSYKETETAAFICEWLEKNGIPYRNGIAGTGIIGTIKGKGSGEQDYCRESRNGCPADNRKKSV